MHPAEVVIRVVPASADQDRVVHRRLDGGAEIVIVADGAGGTSGGAEAAGHVVASQLGPVGDPPACIRELRRLDQELAAARHGGQTTAVLVVLVGGTLFGASVGDSGVLVLTSETIFDLTKDQRAKPLLGSGEAAPVGFGPIFFNDRILVATDGILKYVARQNLRRLAFATDLNMAADELVAAARLPSGNLQDDVGLALLAPVR